MPLQRFEPRRAVEITGPRYGSGYRIGGRLVLSAKHLFPDGTDSSCKVRSKLTFGEIEAKVVWIAPDVDVALVALPPAPDVVKGHEPVVFGEFPSEPDAAIVDFDLYGWPVWAQTRRLGETAKAGGRHIVGKIYLADTSPEGLLVVEPERVAEAPDPDDAGSQWTGISGAAVICNGFVVAVQHHHQNPRRSASLEATSLSKVYDDPDWQWILTSYGIDPKPRPVVMAKDNSHTPTPSSTTRRDVHYSGRTKLAVCQRLGDNWCEEPEGGYPLTMESAPSEVWLYLLARARDYFQRGMYTEAFALNEAVYSKLRNSRSEEMQTLAVNSAIGAAIELRNLGKMEEALATLKDADKIRESREPSLQGQIRRVESSILFEEGMVKESVPLINEASRMLKKSGADAFKLMLNVWRGAWATYLVGDCKYQLGLSELEELNNSVQIADWSITDKEFAKTVWVKTKSGILIAENELTKAQELIEPIIQKWELFPGQTSYFQPTMIADFYRELADILHTRGEYRKAAAFRKKSCELLGLGKLPYFPFLLSERSTRKIKHGYNALLTALAKMDIRFL